MQWDDLKIFLALARQGSVRAAARALKVSASTVARRIDAFEQQLGVRLFDRAPAGYALTAAGRQVLDEAEQVETKVLGIERRLLGRDAELSGPIRLTAPLPLATHLIMPDLVAFDRRYPDISVELALSYDVLDLSRRDADVAVRFMERPSEHLVGRRLPEFYDAVYATPDYIAAHSFAGPDATARWIGWRADGALAKWVQESDFPDCGSVWVMLEVGAQQVAARAGLGMAWLPCFVGDRDPALRRVPNSRPRPGFPGWVLSHPDLKTTERVRALVAFLVEALEAHAELLAGQRPIA